MKIFVIHSNLESEYAQLNVYLEKLAPYAELLFYKKKDKLKLKDRGPFWKIKARSKLKEADCALFLVGSQAHISSNVDWELNYFIKHNKPIYTIKLDPANEYNDVLYAKTQFSNVDYCDSKRYLLSKEVDMSTLLRIITTNSETDLEKELFQDLNGMSEDALIEQYKTYLKTSEDLVARRQSVSSFYISVNSALLAILSAVTAVINVFKENKVAIVGIVCCAFIGAVGLLLSLNWIRVIASYGQLNSAKMKVISAIEKKMPFNIYDTEWKVQTDRLGRKKYLSFTKIEKRIPRLFGVLYVALVFLAFVLFVFL